MQYRQFIRRYLYIKYDMWLILFTKSKTKNKVAKNITSYFIEVELIYLFCIIDLVSAKKDDK